MNIPRKNQLWQKLRHAFAVGTEDAEPVTDKQWEQIDRVCRTVHQRGLTPAALAFLEMSRPLSYLSAQGLHFFEPVATSIFSREEYREFTRFLERRDAIDLIATRLEAWESGKLPADALPSSQSAAPAQVESSDDAQVLNRIHTEI